MNYKSENYSHPDVQEILAHETGAFRYGMTNDYMFHMVVQESKIVQIGLISSLLHIPKDQITSVEIGNPIEVGSQILAKTFVLDIKITLNNAQLINIEMQVQNYGNWCDRSLLYLCREFDHLTKGQPYEEVLPVTHSGIIDFDLFENDTEFYASYMMSNVKSHRIYNSKFRLNVLSLNQINNATDEDKEWNIHTWAALFKAKTWEELKMICDKAPEFQETTRLIYQMNEDDRVREQCRQREDYEKHERTMMHKLKVAETALADAESELSDTKSELADAKSELSDTKSKLSESQKELELLRKRLAELENK